jgi:hypothetical protein
MDDFLKENYAERIREHARIIEDAEVELFKAEAEVKHLRANLMRQAEAKGVRSISGQEVIADSTNELKKAREYVGVIKGKLRGEIIRLSATTTEVEVEKTRHVTMRHEMKAYGHGT